MNLLAALAILLAIALLTLFAYVDRLYTEMGKFFLRGVQDNLAIFELEVEPALNMDRGRASLTFSLLTQSMILMLSVITGYLVFHQKVVAWVEAAEAMVLLVAVVLLFAHLVPHVLITRTTGAWLVRFRRLLRVASLMVLPAVVALSFSFSVTNLGAPAEAEKKPASTAEEMEALMDKGQEHGLLEQEDRELIQSVMQFGDKTVREVMTPRPNIVAVEKQARLEDLLEIIAENHYSRVPVYDGTLDNMEGFVYTRDLVQLSEEERKDIRVAGRLRPVPLVPETKKVSDLLRELQQQNLRMAVVVDEHGSVAGLATVEDLVEEIVGEMPDESEGRPVVVADGHSYLVAGRADVDVLEKIFGTRPSSAGEAATVAGLVNVLAGHVPRTGEIIEAEGLRFEVLKSSERLVERVRISALPAPGTSAPAAD